MRGTRIFALAVAVLAAACSKAPTEVEIRDVTPTTPTPPLVVDVAGTWTGTMTYGISSNRVTVLVTQDGERVHATWSVPARGDVRFDGAFQANRTNPYLAGTVTFSHPNRCETGPLKIGGEPTSRSLTLTGSALWCFDPVSFRLELLKSGPR
jgi:hypothetical protein